jgi:hypothetical protein
MRVLKNPERAEDLVQDVISGLTRSNIGGQLYDVGKYIQDNPTIGRALSLVKRHVHQRSLSVIREQKSTVSLGLKDPDDENSELMDMTGDPGQIDEMDALIARLTGKDGGKLYQVLFEELKKAGASPSKLTIFAEIVKDPEISDVNIALTLGHPEWINRGAATYVSKMRREIKDMFFDILRKKPGLMRQLEDDFEIAPLGYATQSWMRQAKNLARFLKQR